MHRTLDQLKPRSVTQELLDDRFIFGHKKTASCVNKLRARFYGSARIAQKLQLERGEVIGVRGG